MLKNLKNKYLKINKLQNGATKMYCINKMDGTHYPLRPRDLPKQSVTRLDYLFREKTICVKI